MLCEAMFIYFYNVYEIIIDKKNKKYRHELVYALCLYYIEITVPIVMV